MHPLSNFCTVLVLLVPLIYYMMIPSWQTSILYPLFWNGKEELCFSPPLSDDPISSLAAVASLEPPARPNSSCAPPPPSASPSCKDPAFTGKLLPEKRKLVHMILFGFEVIICSRHEETYFCPSYFGIISANKCCYLGGHFGDPPKRDGRFCRPLLSRRGNPNP